MILNSVRKTGRLLALDTSSAEFSIASEIIARVSIDCFDSLRQAPQRLALSHFPTPTSQSLTKFFYKRAEDVIASVGNMMNKEIPLDGFTEKQKCAHDVPGDWFKGPF